MNKKYNKSYLLIDIILMVFIGLSLYLGIFTPNSFYNLVANIMVFLVSTILTAFVFINENEFDVPIKVIAPITTCLTFIIVVVNIFILF